jgi:prolyl 4-hydroxylase
LEKFNDSKILNELNEYFVPTNKDYEGAILAIHRLQDTYLLTPSDLQNNKMSNKFPSIRPLNAFECFEIGRVAYENENYFYAIQWLNESLIQLKSEVDKSTIDEMKILKYYALANAQQGNIKEVIGLMKQVNEAEPSVDIVEKSFKIVLDKINQYKNETQNGTKSEKDYNFFEFKNPPGKKDLDFINYEKLCREDYSGYNISSKKSSQLTCRYVSHHPSLIIAPVKEELLHDNPKIWLYHDVITEDQISYIKYHGKFRLHRSGIFDDELGGIESDIRISHTGWMSDEEFPEMSKLKNLVSAVTKLSLNVSEEWQIVNYGIGGQYESHVDHNERCADDKFDESNVSSRVATWLFYLDAPEKGGSTVFPKIGISFILLIIYLMVLL